jgi:hypothetical protein
MLYFGNITKIQYFFDPQKNTVFWCDVTKKKSRFDFCFEKTTRCSPEELDDPTI